MLNLRADREFSEIHDLLRPGAILAAHQPIVRLADDAIVGYEALARMPGGGLAPDEWLGRASDVGLRDVLELACLRAAAAAGLPPGDETLYVNLSPSLLDHPQVRETLMPIAHRTVIELSEHEAVADYDHLRAAVARWQDDGAKIAIDDTGAGHASLQHVFRIQPDYIKLDRRLVRHLHHDRSMRALLASAVAYAGETGATVIAEGVETDRHLEAVRKAGVELAQGYLLGRPDFGWQHEIHRSRSLRLDASTSITDVGEPSSHTVRTGNCCVGSRMAI
jgi:EAL domain-containing protein (putative c-di-GMP-specific phosphodiesterase class I)